LIVQQQQRPLLLSAYYAGGLPAHSALAWRFLKANALITVALSILSGLAFQALLPLLGQPSLSNHLTAFWLIVVGMAFRCLADFGGMCLFTAHFDRLTTVTNVASVITLLIAQTILLPLAGLYGAGGAILITFVAIAAWRFRLFLGFSLERRRHDKLAPSAGTPAMSTSGVHK
jgi:O-antigen/teichoic acid export membrane protein